MGGLRQASRIPGFWTLWSRFPVGSVPLRTDYGTWDRPHYAYGIYHSALLARALGEPRISVIEFGVAGGNGLLSMERLAERIGAHTGVAIDVIGFDSGGGMPAPVDYRDLPHVWGEGFYHMDVDRLRARLTRARLVIGDVAETVPAFLREGPAPIAFTAFDLDYYSSTSKAFQVFCGAASSRLPRIYAYFDDIIWPEVACHNEYVGELLAIREFNDSHETMKICQLRALRWMRKRPAQWNEQMYIIHDFAHPRYTQRVSIPDEGGLFGLR
jgi:hypothetical protein